MTSLLAALALSIWVYLIFLRGGFWRAGEHDRRSPAAEPERWPAVAAIVPARDEADVAARSIASLVGQDYPGSFMVILVDDNSKDGTAEIVRQAVQPPPGRLTIIKGAPLAPLWTGKLWALHQGIAHVERLAETPEYLLLTDADIVHAPRALRGLVARAEGGGLLLASRMVRLNCESLSERALIPAFVFFFQMLYPFAWVNRPGHRIAAAAGGCMLIAFEALSASGGVAAIRSSLIDDCALAARLKAQGAIWLGLSDCASSIRRYRWGDVRRMVARSAYAQLGYSPMVLFATVAGLCLTFVVPPVIAVLGSGYARGAAAIAWALMALAFWPTLRFYRAAPLWAPLLPLIAACYLGFTLDSAYQHVMRRGGMWKGRSQAFELSGQ